MAGGQEKDVAARLGSFLRVARDAIAKSDPPGLVALIGRNREIFDAALGMRVVEENLPIRRDTIFRIASMTRPITSALILILMEEGKLRLDDSIVKWAPELANRRVLKDPAGPIDDSQVRRLISERRMPHQRSFRGRAEQGDHPAGLTRMRRSEGIGEDFIGPRARTC
jgi:CubicO group peptidase (beta-lactamase class C family)